jgi:hypothetical protein
MGWAELRPRMQQRVKRRTARRRPIVVAALLALGAGGSLAACSSAGDNPFTPFADPGTYAYYPCDQILGQLGYWRSKEQELKLLMEKAGQATGGAVINVIAYQTDYARARDEIKVLEATARIKNCKPKE